MPPPSQSGARLLNSLTAASAPSHQEWLEQALHLALTHRQQGGRPFAALLVRENRLVASAVNRMLEAGDPPVTRSWKRCGKGVARGRWPGPSSMPAGTPAPCACRPW